MKKMRVRNSLTLALILCVAFAAVGCGVSDEEAMQACVDAVTKLEAQTEVHVVGTTMLGETADDLEQSSASEYWISGEDYLWVSTVPGMPELWHLHVDGMSLSAEMADGDLDWQTGDDSGLYLTSWVPPIDLGDYDVKSVVTQGDRQVITLTGADQDLAEGTYDSGSYSDYEAVFTLDAQGDLEKFELSFRAEFPDENGDVSAVYWQWVTEYSEVTEGEVDAYLQELYLEAAG